MVRPVVSARKNTSARDIALQFFTGLYSGMPVTDEEGKVVGVITELDLLDALNDGKDLVNTLAEEVMTKDPFTADIDTPISNIIKIMKEKNVIRIPITNGGKLVGVVARCDVLKGLLEPAFVTYI